MYAKPLFRDLVYFEARVCIKEKDQKVSLVIYRVVDVDSVCI